VPAVCASATISHRWLRDRDDRQAETSGKDKAKGHNEEKHFHGTLPLCP
jgi:hypothetical protein